MYWSFLRDKIVFWILFLRQDSLCWKINLPLATLSHIHRILVSDVTKIVGQWPPFFVGTPDRIQTRKLHCSLRGISHVRYCYHGTPDRIRTCDLELRSLLLYPAELPGRIFAQSRFGAGRENRTLISSLEGWHTKPLYDTRISLEIQPLYQIIYRTVADEKLVAAIGAE